MSEAQTGTRCSLDYYVGTAVITRAVWEVLYTLTPSIDFIDEIKTANARQRDAPKAIGCE